MILVPLLAALFAIFPLTDTDIWWHLACAREWVTAWTPVRGPAVNVHEYFEQVVYAAYSLGGAPLLVAIKSVLWGSIFALFMEPAGKLRGRGWLAGNLCGPVAVAVAAFYLFVFRFQMEMRPVVFTILFLGIYWRVVPWLLARFVLSDKRISGDKSVVARMKICLVAVLLLALQWVWCRFQGLYILGPLFVLLCASNVLWKARKGGSAVLGRREIVPVALLVALFFAMPFLHKDGVALFLYPFGLLDRLLGITLSAAVFASEIAENRSPLTLLVAGENVLVAAFMLVVVLASLLHSLTGLFKYRRDFVLNVSLSVTAVLTLVAERNFVLLLPLFIAVLCSARQGVIRMPNSARLNSVLRVSSVILIAFLLGFWAKSLAAYDRHMVACQRVPVKAAEWMASHPHDGRLFNDDRAGGYLAFVNPADSIYMDGRFILKTADFFERYLQYARDPAAFLHDADSLGVDRAVFPLRFYARWGSLLVALGQSSEWASCYVDEFYIVFCRK